MKKETWVCDCCGKEQMEEMFRLRLPIRGYKGSNNLMASDMDICSECATKISDVYYKTAIENNKNGFMFA